MTMEFQGFGKIARLDREIIVTEKIDGTNAQILITGANEISIEGLTDNHPDAAFQDEYALAFDVECGVAAPQGLAIYAGSRNRMITPDNDNYGFAQWVKENARELFALGRGRHFGEWWGAGINRGYGVDGRYFSLFNTSRWEHEVPTCCKVVPVLYQGKFSQERIEWALDRLRSEGSVAAPGFMEPEGVVVYHTASNTLFKKTIGNDGPKGE
jgi:hypothetical protein